jgi:anti-anti-sigma factor
VAAEEAVDLASTDGDYAPLLRDIEARLAEVDAFPPDSLVVGLWTAEDLCVVALAGEMDMSNAAELTEMLNGCLSSGPCRLLVEASRLTFIDSTGLNQLITVSRPLKARGGETLIVAPSVHVARVLQFVQVDELITVADSLEDALTRAAVGRPGAGASEAPRLSQLDTRPEPTSP